MKLRNDPPWIPGALVGFAVYQASRKKYPNEAARIKAYRLRKRESKAKEPEPVTTILPVRLMSPHMRYIYKKLIRNKVPREEALQQLHWLPEDETDDD